MDDYSDITTAVRQEFAMMTPDQVCELLQVKKSWLYDQVAAGVFPVQKVGHFNRFRVVDIRQYLEGVQQPLEVAVPEPPQPVRRGRPRK